MNIFCKCLKCGKIFSPAGLTEEQNKKIGRDGCLNCQSKNLEFNLDDGEFRLHYITNQCSKCSKIKIIDILNWEELKGRSIKRGVKTKEEFIKKMNDENDNACYCG